MDVINALNYAAVNYGPAILASGLLSPIISALLKMVERFKWTNNDLVRTLFALSVFIAAAVYHALLTSRSLDPRVVVVQGMVGFVIAQPFFYLLVRPGFKLIGEIVAKSKAFDAINATPVGVAGATAAGNVVSPVADFNNP